MLTFALKPNMKLMRYQPAGFMSSLIMVWKMERT